MDDPWPLRHLVLRTPRPELRPDDDAGFDERAEVAPQRWVVNFLVRLDGHVVGTQGIEATDFAVIREVDTGSWIGRRHHGRGVGTEMRAAVLLPAFDHLDATQARTGRRRRVAAGCRRSSATAATAPPC